VLLLCLIARPLPAAADGDVSHTGEASQAQAAPRAASNPAASCAEKVASRVQSHYESVRDLAAHFEQKTRSVTLGDASLAGGEPVTGSVVFAKPGRMRWSYEAPEPSLLVSDGAVLWLYDPVAREAQRLPVKQGYLTGAALEFLLGEGNLLAEFEVSAGSCDAEADGEVDLELQPRQPASYERLGLRVRAITGEVLATHVVDLFGNVTRIAFSEIRTNQDPPGELFTFEVPQGVEVFDLIVPGG
jgi:outer membrane lipoprotein carrier protein